MKDVLLPPGIEIEGHGGGGVFPPPCVEISRDTEVEEGSWPLLVLKSREMGMEEESSLLLASK